jgi:hypothetical protein
MVLDHKTDRRELNLPPLLDLYGQGQLVRGFLMGDNRRDAEAFDQACALLFPAMIAATWIDPKPQAGFNVLADVFRHHRVATLRSWAGWLPVQHFPAWGTDLPEVYVTQASFAEAQVIRGVAQVLSRPDLQALPLTPAPRPRFVYAVAPLRPDPELRDLAGRVRANLAGELDHDTSLSFASVGYPLTPTTEQAPLAVVSLFPVSEGLEGVRYLMLGGPLAAPFRPRGAVPGRAATEPSDSGAPRNGRGG